RCLPAWKYSSGLLSPPARGPEETEPRYRSWKNASRAISGPSSAADPPNSGAATRGEKGGECPCRVASPRDMLTVLSVPTPATRAARVVTEKDRTMPLRVACPKCHTAYNIPDNMQGKGIRCQKCQQAFRVRPLTP